MHFLLPPPFRVAFVLPRIFGWITTLALLYLCVCVCRFSCPICATPIFDMDKFFKALDAEVGIARLFRQLGPRRKQEMTTESGLFVCSKLCRWRQATCTRERSVRLTASLMLPNATNLPSSGLFFPSSLQQSSPLAFSYKWHRSRERGDLEEAAGAGPQTPRRSATRSAVSVAQCPC